MKNIKMLIAIIASTGGHLGAASGISVDLSDWYRETGHPEDRLSAEQKEQVFQEFPDVRAQYDAYNHRTLIASVACIGDAIGVMLNHPIADAVLRMPELQRRAVPYYREIEKTLPARIKNFLLAKEYCDDISLWRGEHLKRLYDLLQENPSNRLPFMAEILCRMVVGEKLHRLAFRIGLFMSRIDPQFELTLLKFKNPLFDEAPEQVRITTWDTLMINNFEYVIDTFTKICYCAFQKDCEFQQTHSELVKECREYINGVLGLYPDDFALFF